MLTQDEEKFIKFWEYSSRHKGAMMVRQIYPGFLWGFILGCGTVLPPFAVMRKKQLEITPGILIIFLCCILLIGTFVGFLRWRMYQEKNEQLYRLLKLKEP
jgi:hypothetical protein